MALVVLTQKVNANADKIFEPEVSAAIGLWLRRTLVHLLRCWAISTTQRYYFLQSAEY